MAVMPDRAVLWLLVGSGAIIAIGGALHPEVPAVTDDQMAHVAASTLWVPAHWLLTLAQPAAIPGVLAVAQRVRALTRERGAAAAGGPLAAFGFAVGALGTLAAASALKAAATVGDVALYRVVETWTLALGWFCIVATSAGGALVGFAAVRVPGLASARALGWIVLATSLVALVAAAALPPTHPWMHAVLLRAGAVVEGLILAALGAWSVAHAGPMPTART